MKTQTEVKTKNPALENVTPAWINAITIFFDLSSSSTSLSFFLWVSIASASSWNNQWQTSSIKAVLSQQTRTTMQQYILTFFFRASSCLASKNCWGTPLALFCALRRWVQSSFINLTVFFSINPVSEIWISFPFASCVLKKHVPFIYINNKTKIHGLRTKKL